ncbi:MAG: DNA polymerase III subunit delta [Actinobacteria bacterium]|jgi:DNA polymerase-3 subunit delta|nr:DNA polymerase III subunit delta [Actinomycetota bacterium]MCL6095065.1 DNA polymerase III subunit delta [Actinomycetota bacterium]
MARRESSSEQHELPTDDKKKNVYLFRGDDSSIVDQAAHDLIGQLLDGGDPALSVEEFQVGGETDVVSLAIDACRTPPFFSDKRIVVLRNIGKASASDLTALEDYLRSPSSTSCLVLTASSGKLPATVVAAVRENGVIEELNQSNFRWRKEWINKKVTASSVRLDREALEQLEEHIGTDLNRLESLLDTLTVVYGDKAKLSVEEIVPFLGRAGSTEPWRLTDRIDAGDVSQALAVLNRLLINGQFHPLAVLAILYKHYESLLKLDGLPLKGAVDAQKVLGLSNELPAKKLLVMSRKLGSGRLREAIVLLGRADLDLRGATNLSPQIVLEILVARLTRLSRLADQTNRTKQALRSSARKRYVPPGA